MLLDDAYNILDLEKETDSRLIAKVNINKSHEMFNGHFPNNPVTPGVLMLQIIKNCLENEVGKSLLMQKSSNVKFLSLVNPEEEHELTFYIDIQKDENGLKIKNHTSFKDGRSVLKCNATFVEYSN